MFLPQSNLFKDIRQETINEISEAAKETDFNQGDVLFNEGDPADHFYILVEGSVRLSIGKQSKTNYMVKHIGEAFGWSSVVGRDLYTAGAECVAPSKLLKIHKDELEQIFEVHERSGRTFYKVLASLLGQRLIDLHQ
ncbi:Crp/Fnr family transcriptional regulator [Thermodesulfobacteriota bacterium]